MAGKGGNGSYTFFTDKNVRRGAPDGGEGGSGGSISVQASKYIHDLSHLRLRNIVGNDGNNGGTSGKNGKNGGLTILTVPCGTLVY